MLIKYLSKNFAKFYIPIILLFNLFYIYLYPNKYVIIFLLISTLYFIFSILFDQNTHSIFKKLNILGLIISLCPFIFPFLSLNFSDKLLFWQFTPFVKITFAWFIFSFIWLNITVTLNKNLEIQPLSAPFLNFFFWTIVFWIITLWNFGIEYTLINIYKLTNLQILFHLIVIFLSGYVLLLFLSKANFKLPGTIISQLVIIIGTGLIISVQSIFFPIFPAAEIMKYKTFWDEAFINPFFQSSIFNFISAHFAYFPIFIKNNFLFINKILTTTLNLSMHFQVLILFIFVYFISGRKISIKNLILFGLLIGIFVISCYLNLNTLIILNFIALILLYFVIYLILKMTSNGKLSGLIGYFFILVLISLLIFNITKIAQKVYFDQNNKIKELL